MSGDYGSIHATRPWDKPQRQEGEAYDHQCDTPEKINICLNCTIEGGCKPKSRDCKLSRYAPIRKKIKPMSEKEIEWEVLRLTKAGWGVYRIRTALHIGNRKVMAVKEKLRSMGEIE